jgi:type VI secretion system protein ImpA
VTGILERISEVVVNLGGVVAASEGEAGYADPSQAQVNAPGEIGASAAPQSGAGSGKIMTREDALREMDRIAEFFRRTEPHSPLAYTLEEAVRRGRMSLAELLAEVLPDGDARASMLSRLGIRPPE